MPKGHFHQFRKCLRCTVYLLLATFVTLSGGWYDARSVPALGWLLFAAFYAPRLPSEYKRDQFHARM